MRFGRPQLSIGGKTLNLRPYPPTSRAFLGHVRALRDETRAAIAVEYGLIAALIVLAILGSIKALGDNLGSLPLASIVAALS
jgi:Flp pilus assembly pilin Flp